MFDYHLSIVRPTIEPLGYEFLGNIRKNEVWEKLKSLDFQNLNLTECIDFGRKLSVKWIEKKLGI